jgi:hypothetical protein
MALGLVSVRGGLGGIWTRNDSRTARTHQRVNHQRPPGLDRDDDECPNARAQDVEDAAQERVQGVGLRQLLARNQLRHDPHHRRDGDRRRKPWVAVSTTSIQISAQPVITSRAMMACRVPESLVTRPRGPNQGQTTCRLPDTGRRLVDDGQQCETVLPRVAQVLSATTAATFSPVTARIYSRVVALRTPLPCLHLGSRQ